MTDTGAVRARLLERHGRTYADEAGLTLRDKPAPLHQLLVLAHLLSANLDAALGVRAASVLRRRFRTAPALAEASEEDRWQALSDARFLRKERTADLLGRTAVLVVEEYRGDLRRLRDRADGDAAGVASLVQEMPGIGAVGADIFCREVQAVWPSLRPYADDRVRGTARRLGLPDSVEGLCGLAGTDDLSVLGAALVRCDLADDVEGVRHG